MRPSRSPNLLPGDYQPSSQRSQHFLAISQAFYCGGANIPRIRLQRGSDMMEGKLRKRRHTAEWNKLDCMQSFAVCRVSNKYPKQECSCTTSNCRFMCVSVAARRLRPKRFYKSTTSRIHQHLVFIPAETSPSMTAPSSLSLHSHARFPPILHDLPRTYLKSTMSSNHKCFALLGRCAIRPLSIGRQMHASTLQHARWCLRARHVKSRLAGHEIC